MINPHAMKADYYKRAGLHFLVRAQNLADAQSTAQNLIAEIRTSTNLTVIAIRPLDKSIQLEQLRNVRPLLKHKNQSLILVDISPAELMTPETQNYLLKELEDAQSNKIYVLSGTYSSTLKKTIISRTIQLNYRPQTQNNLKPADNLIYRASGYSAELLKSYQALNLEENLARNWLIAKPLQRISLTQNLKLTPEALDFAVQLKIYLSALMVSAASKNEDKQLLRTIISIEAVEDFESRVMKYTNLKLNLTNLAIRV